MRRRSAIGAASTPGTRRADSTGVMGRRRARGRGGRCRRLARQATPAPTSHSHHDEREDDHRSRAHDPARDLPVAGVAPEVARAVTARLALA